jgi:curved DNA-binding protein CbpA
MQTYYQLLNVSETASPAILKIAYAGRLKALESEPLPETQKAAERRQLEQAYLTLSNPAKRDWYDRRLADSPAEHRKPVSKGLVIGVAAVLVVAAAGGAWQWSERSRAQRIEAARLALEKQRAEREAEAERIRLDQAQQRIDMVRESQQATITRFDRAYADQQSRYDAARAASESQAARSAQAAATREQHAAEQRDKAQADAELRRARQDAERQAAWVRQREAEEKRAAIDRYNHVQAEERARLARERAANKPTQ